MAVDGIGCICIAILFCSLGAIECPDRFVTYQGSCYLFAHDVPMTFSAAENYCRQHHGHVVHLETADENMFVRDFLRGLKAEYHWLGLTDEIVEGQWRWYDTNTNAEFFDWTSGEPNNQGDEDCVIFDWYHDYTWTDVKCTSSYEPVCEVSAADLEIIG